MVAVVEPVAVVVAAVVLVVAAVVAALLRQAQAQHNLQRPVRQRLQRLLPVVKVPVVAAVVAVAEQPRLRALNLRNHGCLSSRWTASRSLLSKSGFSPSAL